MNLEIGAHFRAVAARGVNSTSARIEGSDYCARHPRRRDAGSPATVIHDFERDWGRAVSTGSGHMSPRSVVGFVVALLVFLPACGGGGNAGTVRGSGAVHASMGTSTLGLGGWEVRSSALARATGGEISSHGF